MENFTVLDRSASQTPVTLIFCSPTLSTKQTPSLIHIHSTVLYEGEKKGKEREGGLVGSRD